MPSPSCRQLGATGAAATRLNGAAAPGTDGPGRRRPHHSPLAALFVPRGGIGFVVAPSGGRFLGPPLLGCRLRRRPASCPSWPSSPSSPPSASCLGPAAGSRQQFLEGGLDRGHKPVEVLHDVVVGVEAPVDPAVVAEQRDPDTVALPERHQRDTGRSVQRRAGTPGTGDRARWSPSC